MGTYADITGTGMVVNRVNECADPAEAWTVAVTAEGGPGVEGDGGGA